MKFIFLIKRVLCLLLIVTVFKLNAQNNVPQGINYQAVARNSSGFLLANQTISVKIAIRSTSASGIIEWEETHSVLTNQFGLFNLIIGQGTSTGNGSVTSFSNIPWSNANHFITTSIDPSGGSSYIIIDTMQLWSVPYAFHSASSGSSSASLRLNDLADVDTNGVVNGYVLKWNGSIWLPMADNDSDTVLYSYNSYSSQHSDTANYSLNLLSQIDTVNFSYYSGSSNYSTNSGTSTNSQNSIHCDTALYAFSTGNSYTYWNLNGNSGTTISNFIGTTDAKDFILKTNNTERLRVLSSGKVGIGTSAPVASFQVSGVDGVLLSGAFGSGTTLNLGQGTRMHWYPKKAAFRVGYASGTQWDDVNIGNYSFSSGNSNTASGSFSAAMGQVCTASGANSLAVGYGSVAGNESSVALGSICSATGVYSVALGRGINATDSSSVGIGYHSNATGKFAFAFGAYTTASGNYSTTMGWYANSNGKKGSFVYADNSSTTATVSSADNQFVVRASGGVVFYSNSTMTNGVSLPAGGGSWASVSDKNKKENFNKVDANTILSKIQNLEISTWNYKTQPKLIRHIGPMAQDFYGTFGYGESDTTITTVDIDGVNLLALQALAIKSNELKKKAEELESLKLKIEKLENEKIMLEKRIVNMEKQFIEKQSLTTFTSKNK